VALIGKVAAIVALLLMMGGDAGTGVAAQPTLLRVEITGLPAGIGGLVTITGPRGVAYTATATDERPVTPGTYTVAIRPVRGPGSTHYPADDQHQVTVEPQRTTTTAAAYRVTIPDTTNVLDPADPAILLVRGTEIRLAAGSPIAGRIEPGDHLVSGEGPRVPHLLVRRVTSTRRLGDQVVVNTVGASFDQAIPQGVLRFDTIDGLKLIRPAAHTGQDDDPLVDVDFSLRYARGACSAASDAPRASSLAGHLKYQLDSIDLDLDGELDWDLTPPSVSVSAGAELTVRHSIEAEIEAAVRCQVDAERDIPIGCARVLARLVRIGPISLECEFKIVGEAFVESSASWRTGAIEAETTLGFEFGFDSDDGFEADPTFTNDRTGDEPAMPEHESSFGASLGLQVGLAGKDPSGTAKVSIGLKVTTGPTITSSSTEFTAKLEATPKIELEAKLDPHLPFVGEWKEGLDFTLPKVSVTLWEISRSTPLPRSTTRPPSRPGSTPAPPPTTTTSSQDQSFFLGEWSGHNRLATIRQDGTAHISWRDYSARHTGDPFFFVELDGALRPSGDTMVGEVTGSNTPLIPVGTPVRLERYSDDPYTMEANIGTEVVGSFCNGEAPPGYCGA